MAEESRWQWPEGAVSVSPAERRRDVGRAGESQPAVSSVDRSSTRYLCAGAYLDQDFRRQVLRDVLEQEHRAVAPSYSIDVVPIIKHCLAAQRRETVRDGLITVSILIALVLAFREVVGILTLLYSLLCYLRALRHLGQGNLVGAAVQGVLGFILMTIGFSFVALSQAGIVGAGLSGVTGAVGASGTRVVFALFVATVGTAAVLVWYQVSEHQIILDELTEDRFDPARAPAEPPEHRDRLDYLGQSQYGNVTIYSRATSRFPFVGSGWMTDGWSLAIPLVPEKAGEAGGDGGGDGGEDGGEGPDATPPQPLTIEALYRRVRRALVHLADPERPEAERIAGLSLQDRLFVMGLLPDSHELIDANRQPRSRISRHDMMRLAEHERNTATYFLTTRISGWRGELEVTVFLYFNIRGNMLYVEFIATSLPPLKATFHVIDTYERMSSNVVLRAMLVSALATPRALLNAPINLANPVIASIRHRLDVRAQVQQITSRIAFDYGAVSSVRAIGAEWQRENFFHTLDSNRYTSVVERRVIDAMGEVLGEFGYSTEYFQQRTNQIIDNRVFSINNSTFTDSPVAMGDKSRAKNVQQGSSASSGPGGRGGGSGTGKS